MAENDAPPQASPLSSSDTNAPHAIPEDRPAQFNLEAFLITGNSLLSIPTLQSVLTNHLGTNLGIADITEAGKALQLEYRRRGYPTVNVTIPPQQITNGTLKIRVFEGQLTEILVLNNRHFSSNNILRALPSLKPGTILLGPVFQSELDQANANSDRQVYPELGPGAEDNTTQIRLKVRDRLPLHAKTELNNQYSPGTPELRLNSSAVYNNLWQREHALGVQYSFSPKKYKTGDDWAFYDLPLVANYSAFYRLPLGNPVAASRGASAGAGGFGYDEASRRFRLPPATGLPELNVYASRSTIDTGVIVLSDRVLQDIPGVISIRERDDQQDITINGSVGARLGTPLRTDDTNFRLGISAGLDYKTYSLTSYKTNTFFITTISVDQQGRTNTVSSQVSSEVPKTSRVLDYLPLTLRLDASLRDSLGVTSFGLGLSGNLWHSGDTTNLHAITGSSESAGHWITVSPSISRDFIMHTNWVLAVRADAQVAGEPLISNEQFGAGGVGNVRGYLEGEAFGDLGWRVNLEQKTPPYVVGMAYGKAALTVRASVYMDYAEIYLLDAGSRDDLTRLWGAGFGAVATVGSHWEARLLFSWPLLSTDLTRAGSPRFGFALTAQF